ncbi:hypothetical protein Dsin_028842 [Dipteronia sinensis]|uniref:Phosphomannose isomerase type I helical insertion domain-containing protein n=1 Tax=Dipteronia sinensis TaxID=43782 RepID=A0AAE0DUY0_9ROSI|nr:hypothetical protein Dsin_028842 [Dipteronia sinensis]
MTLALTEFEAVCGFISLQGFQRFVAGQPGLARLTSFTPSTELFKLGFSEPIEGFCYQFRDASQILVCEPNSQYVKAGLQSIFSQILLSSKDKIGEIISKLKQRLKLEKKERRLTEKEELVMRLEDQYPDDAACMCHSSILTQLCEAEALCLGANEPHAYIHEILGGVSLNQPPFDEFDVDRCILPQTATIVFPSVARPYVFLFLAGYAIGYARSKKYKFEEALARHRSSFIHLLVSATNSTFNTLFKINMSKILKLDYDTKEQDNDDDDDDDDDDDGSQSYDRY